MKFNTTTIFVFIRIAAVIVGCGGGVRSQHLVIERSELREGKVHLHYTITDTVPGKFYTVRLYSSQDNFMHPLAQVSGDIGMSLRPGVNKMLVWDPVELGEHFNGKVRLEIRAREYVPFVHFPGFKGYTRIKRQKPYTLTWSGGSASNILNFELVRGEEKVMVFSNIANVGSHTFLLPHNIRPGGNYRFVVSDSRNKDEVVVTETFSVKRKMPLLAKAVPLLLVGGIIYMLLPDEQPNNDIQDPIIPGS